MLQNLTNSHSTW